MNRTRGCMRILCSRVPLLCTLCFFHFNFSYAATNFQEQSERLQLIYVHLLDFRSNGAPFQPEKSIFQLALDILIIPKINNRIGSRDEEIEALPLIPRPRVRYFHYSGIFAGAFWLPPLEIKGYEANVYGWEGGWNFSLGWLLLRPRFYYSTGRIIGQITEVDSKDQFSFDRRGADFSLGKQFNNFTPYLAYGAGVVSTQATIESDGAILRVKDHHYDYAVLGISGRFGDLLINFEQYRTDTFLRHFAISLAYDF